MESGFKTLDGVPVLVDPARVETAKKLLSQDDNKDGGELVPRKRRKLDKEDPVPVQDKELASDSSEKKDAGSTTENSVAAGMPPTAGGAASDEDDIWGEELSDSELSSIADALESSYYETTDSESSTATK